MRCFKKRILAVCMVLCCVLGLSVQSSAAATLVSYDQLESWAKNMLEPLPGVTNGYKVKVSTEGMTDTQKAEWEKVMTEYLNDPNYTFVFTISAGGVFVFCTLSDPPFSYTSNRVNINNAIFFNFGNYGAFHDFRASYNSSVGTSGFFYSWSTSTDLATNSNVYSSFRVLDFEAFAIDDGIEREDPEPPSSSTPDQPSSSETSSIPYVPSGPPDFGTVDSEYLPYDTSIWEALMWYLRDIIGAAGKILLLIMFIVTIVPVIVSAIKHYLGDHNDHGSGIL